MYTIYILKSIARKWVYVGMSSEFKTRLQRHQNGGVQSTKAYRPFIVLYTETQPDARSARLREKYLKSRSGKRWIYKNFIDK